MRDGTERVSCTDLVCESVHEVEVALGIVYLPGSDTGTAGVRYCEVCGSEIECDEALARLAAR